MGFRRMRCIARITSSRIRIRVPRIATHLAILNPPRSRIAPVAPDSLGPPHSACSNRRLYVIANRPFRSGGFARTLDARARCLKTRSHCFPARACTFPPLFSFLLSPSPSLSLSLSLSLCPSLFFIHCDAGACSQYRIKRELRDMNNSGRVKA
jgi:hypothetical protein